MIEYLGGFFFVQKDEKKVPSKEIIFHQSYRAGKIRRQRRWGKGVFDLKSFLFLLALPGSRSNMQACTLGRSVSNETDVNRVTNGRHREVHTSVLQILNWKMEICRFQFKGLKSLYCLLYARV